VNPKDKGNSIAAWQWRGFLRRNKITQAVTRRVFPALGFARTMHYIASALPLRRDPHLRQRTFLIGAALPKSRSPRYRPKLIA
jgi:hypothetical protein